MLAALNTMLFGKHLEEDEKVSAIFHAHWLMGFRALALPVLSILCSLSLFGLSILRQTSDAVILLLAGWGVFSIVWLFRSFFDYYLDAWIVTDKGIIDLEWHGWFHRESSRVLYSDIQGVSYEINGVASTMLGFGTVSIEKISTGSSISLPYVPKPQSLESLILRNMEAYMHTKNMKDARHVQEILAGIVSQNVQLDELGKKKSAGSITPTERVVQKGDEGVKRKKRGFQPRKI